ncbi:Trans-aconitate 3-methyltransferase [Leucoagaricus sp. SymC.cos]|nr:Trans-aconitate 3-methyltransferase [Leucoagaricus sp. SymC.cos]
MATFANSTFNAAVYSASRPTYPKQLFEYIFNYHRRKPNARWDRALDTGCGTGQATKRLTPFREIVGLDPSENMIKAVLANRDFFPPSPSLSATSASTATVTPGGGNVFRFKHGNAEGLATAGIVEESVDLVAAAQACHWFDWNKVWPETERVLRVGGTAAFWIYSEFRLPQYPSLTLLITAYAQGTDKLTSLGPYFERPGRTILERHLLDVPSPEKVLTDQGRLRDEERVYFAGDYHTQTLPVSQTLSVIMRKEMRWRDLLGYFQTWSSLHKYHEVFPQDKSTPHDGRFMEDLTTIYKIWAGPLDGSMSICTGHARVSGFG